MKYKKNYKLRISKATGKYVRVRPVKSNSFEYQVFVKRVVTKLNQGLTPKRFHTLQEFLDWFKVQPNYMRITAGYFGVWI